MEMDGRTVLVTGGGTGIGLALAERFRAKGCRVAICGRRPEVLERHGHFESLVCDLAIPEERERLAGVVAERFPDLSILVNNAGIQRALDLTGPLSEWGEWCSEIAINLEAPIHLTGLLLPLLRARDKAAIVNVTSGLSFAPLANVPIYSATKAALHSFTLSLRHQLRGTAVAVLEVVPPAVDTDLQAPGLHTFGVNVDEFADSVFADLQAGAIEVGFGTSNIARNGSRVDLDEIFRHLNP